MARGIHIPGRTLQDIHVNGHNLKAVWIRGQKVWPNMIEDFEGITSYDQAFRGTFTGSTSITSNAALATSKGSTQGLRCFGFVEMWSEPGDHETPLRKGEWASFYFRPRNFDSGDQWHFILAPQADKADPPNHCYRLEFHMGGGSRITRISSGSRTVLDTENRTNWSNQTYECEFRASSSGVTMKHNGRTLSTSNTTYVDNIMGFGFRASGGGTADYDWVGYV